MRVTAIRSDKRRKKKKQALVGQDAPFEHGREPDETAGWMGGASKSVERVAEAIGADITRRATRLPIVVGEPILCSKWTAPACP